MFQKILNNKYLRLISGALLSATSFHDILKDVTSIHKEHLTLLIGVILIFDSITDFVSQTRGIVRTVRKKEEFVFSKGMQRFIQSRAYIISAGIIIIIGSIYDISEDVLVMRKEHFELGIGIFFIFMAFRKMKEERKKIRSCFAHEVIMTKEKEIVAFSLSTSKESSI
jgi:predicted ribosome-associated RNA-binding protein Tma20